MTVIWDWNGTLLDDMQVCLDIMDRILARRRQSIGKPLASGGKLLYNSVEKNLRRTHKDGKRPGKEKLC